MSQWCNPSNHDLAVDSLDCIPPGSSVRGILQARILEGVVISSSRGSSWARVWARISCIAGGFFTIWATREALSFSFTLHLRFRMEWRESGEAQNERRGHCSEEGRVRTAGGRIVGKAEWRPPLSGAWLQLGLPDQPAPCSERQSDLSVGVVTLRTSSVSHIHLVGLPAFSFLNVQLCCAPQTWSLKMQLSQHPWEFSDHLPPSETYSGPLPLPCRHTVLKHMGCSLLNSDVNSLPTWGQEWCQSHYDILTKICQLKDEWFSYTVLLLMTSTSIF